MHPFRFGVQVSELPFDSWADRVRWHTQVGFTAVADDPTSLQAELAEATGVSPAVQDESTIFLTGTPTEARDRLLRRREETSLSYLMVFDLAKNYARPDGFTQTLPGDAGPGAGDRYLESFAEHVIQPLTGQ